jgi:hypothetical protein
MVKEMTSNEAGTEHGTWDMILIVESYSFSYFILQEFFGL